MGFVVVLLAPFDRAKRRALLHRHCSPLWHLNRREQRSRMRKRSDDDAFNAVQQKQIIRHTGGFDIHRMALHLV
jgi:hypothetical protein